MNPEEKFHLKNGEIISNLDELKEEIKKNCNSNNLDNFYFHVNDSKNDYANWIKHILNEQELAKLIEKEKTPETILEILKEYEKTHIKTLQESLKQHQNNENNLEKETFPPKKEEVTIEFDEENSEINNFSEENKYDKELEQEQNELNKKLNKTKKELAKETEKLQETKKAIQEELKKLEEKEENLKKLIEEEKNILKQINEENYEENITTSEELIKKIRERKETLNENNIIEEKKQYNKLRQTYLDNDFDEEENKNIKQELKELYDKILNY